MNLKILMFLTLAITLLAPMALADISLADDQATSFSYNYQELDDDIDDEVTLTFAVELENTGEDNSTVTLELNSNDADYTVDFSDSDDANFNLTVGDSREVTLDITIDVSDLKDQGTYSDIIEIEVTEGSESPVTFSFDAEVENMFDLKEIYFFVDDDEEGSMDVDDSNDDDADVDIKPGDEVTIYFNIENLFDKDFDHGDMEFDITVELDDSDFGDDIDEDLNENIDAGDEIDDSDEEFSIQFDVPMDAEEGDDYELIITVEAQDDDGAEYFEEWVANLNVEREDEDVRIDDISVYPETVECGDSFGLTIDVMNYGADKQRDMFLAVDGEDLGIDDDATFDLSYGHDEDDNEETLSFQFFIDDDQEEGSYDITVRAYYDNGDDLADSDQITIDVTCHVEEEEVAEEIESEDDTEEVVETITFEDDSDESAADDTSSSDSDTSSEKVSTVEKSYTSNDVEYGLTIALIVLVALAILALLLVGFRKK